MILQNIHIKILVLVFLLVCAFNASGENNGLPEKITNESHSTIYDNIPVDYVTVNQNIFIRNHQMLITSLSSDLGHAASGEGEVYLPLIDENVAVYFDEIMVNAKGELISGEIRSLANNTITPSYQSKASEITDYLKGAKEADQLPLLLNPYLEMKNMDFGGHHLVMTNMTINEKDSKCDVIFMVQNFTGKASIFEKKDLAFDGSEIDFCDAMFPIQGGDQVNFDVEFPLTIKGFNPQENNSEDQGTYVSFTCEGLDSFQLSAYYEFDPTNLRLADKSATDPVITTFSVKMKTWGQFMATATFNGPFEIVGVDDVVLTVSEAIIDYNDTANPSNDSLSAYIDGLASYAGNKELWRGFTIKELSIQLPQSLALGANGERITFGAKDLIYDHANGISANVGLFPGIGEDYVAEGNISGWGVAVEQLVLEVRYNSPVKFELNGDVQMPIIKESIDFDAQFTFADNSGGSNTPASLNFLMDIEEQTFTVPLLKDAVMNLQNSTAGFEYTSGKFTPYANFNGDFSLDFTSSGGDNVAGDFKFPTLGFQGFTLNYNSLSNAVIPESGNTGGLGNMNFFAFNFAGMTFPTGGAGQTTVPDSETNSSQDQKVKGFPIGVKNIAFSQVGNDKQLDFTLALNFTKPSVGLTASAGLSIRGQLNVGEIMTSTPWKALEFKSLSLNAITIGSEEAPVDIGGVSLYGGLLSIEKDPTYGDGFKGFLVMKVEPGITVDVVGQFGTIEKSPGTLDYRYWFADAKMTMKKGVQIGPTALGIFGFGGGAYYNMEQQFISTNTALDVSSNSGELAIPVENAEPVIPGNLLTPGVGLSCTYLPKNNVFGVNATVVLGTYPKPATANMDLTLNIEFNAEPFGLKTVSLSGGLYVMAPIEDRAEAKITGSTAIVYNHTGKTLTIDGSVAVKVYNEVLKKNIITGGGAFAMFFNLNENKGSDWYIALGAPPIAKRMGMSLHITSSPQVMNGYFVAGNVTRLPPDKKDLPKLGEYHRLLEQFEGRNNLSYEGLMNGNSILMGASYSYDVNKRFGPLGASLDFIVGFDAMLNICDCKGYNPTGIDGWYLQGQLFGALEGKIDIKVNLTFHKGTYKIASVNAGALVQGKLPNPTWMSADVAGSYNILGGLIKGKFKINAEFGDECDQEDINLIASEVIADIKVIGAVAPHNGATDVPIYGNKILVTSFLEQINGVMDFSAESDDGLKVKPFIRSKSFTGGTEAPGGKFTLVNGGKALEYTSGKLLQPNTEYTFDINVGWKKYTNDTKQWVEVYNQNSNGDNTTKVQEIVKIKFTTGDRPTTLPSEAIFASYPDYRAINYAIDDNPYGGLSLKQTGWGYLFNPKKKIKVDGKQCNEYPEFEYDYVLRIKDVQSEQVVFQDALTAIPTPEWGKAVDGLVSYTESPCTCDDPFLNWVYEINNVSCTKFTTGPCSVVQPNAATTKSNVKGMSNIWDFGGAAYNFDIPVSATAGRANRNVGFPDFSSALEKNKIYSFEVVGIPIIEASTYEVSNSSSEITETADSDNSITITTKSQSIQKSNVVAAPEIIIYKSDFGTSNYNTFIEKLAATKSNLTETKRWEPVGSMSLQWIRNLFNTSDWKLKYLASEVVDCKSDLDCYYCRLNMEKCKQEILESTEYLPYHVSYEFKRESTNINLDALEYNLVGIEEGFDVYELRKFAYFANYDWETGYSSYLSENSTNFSREFDYQVYPKPAKNPYDNSLIPSGPFSFLSKSNNGNGILDLNQTEKVNTGDIDVMFYPRTSIVYQAIRTKLVTSDYNPNTYPFNFKRSFSWIPFDLEKVLENIKGYQEIDPEYGPLFSLGYEKGGLNAVINFNADGANNVNFVDYSGEDYYLKNLGSGRLISIENNGIAVSTKNQEHNDNMRFTLRSKGNGTYSLQSQSTQKFIGLDGNNLVVNDGNVTISLETDAEGINRIKIENAGYLYEDFLTKNLLVGDGVRDDYDKWILTKTWSEAPEDLNHVYRLQNSATQKYLYDGENTSEKIVSSKIEDMGDHAHFALRRRKDGNYNILNKNGNSVRAELKDEKWRYTTTTSFNSSEESYLYEIIKIGNTITIKNKASNEYLMEGLGGEIVSKAQFSNNNKEKFILRHPDYYHLSQDLAGEYFLKIDGSSSDLIIENSKLVKSRANNSNKEAAKFVLESIDNSAYYHIRNKAQFEIPEKKGFLGIGNIPAQPLVLSQTSDNSFKLVTTKNDSSTFLIVPNNNGDMKIINKASGDYLSENFDINFGNLHGEIIAAKEYDDYATIKMDTDYSPNEENISGMYFLKLKSTGSYISTALLEQGGVTSTVKEYGENLKYVLKRKSGGLYEIYSLPSKIGLFASNNQAVKLSQTAKPSLFNLSMDSGAYKISNSGQFLNLDNNGHVFLNGTSQNAELFVLQENYTIPDGDYFIQNHGSGRHLTNINVNENLTLTQAINESKQYAFSLVQVGNGIYKIKSKLNNAFLHLNNNGSFTSKVLSNLPEDNYKFEVIPISGNTVQIKCLVNNKTLKEEYRAQYNQTINYNVGYLAADNNLEEDYSYFDLKTDFEQSTENITGVYFLQAAGSGDYVNNEDTLNTKKIYNNFGGWFGNNNSADNISLYQFLFKRKSNGNYKIMSGDGTSHIDEHSNSLFYKNDAPDANSEFELKEVKSGFYSIKNVSTGNYLTDHFDVALGSAHKMIKGRPTIDESDSYFKLRDKIELIDKPLDFFDTNVHIRFKGNYNFLLSTINEGKTFEISNNSRSSFVLKPKSLSQEFEIWSVDNGKRLHFTIENNKIEFLTSDNPALDHNNINHTFRYSDRFLEDAASGKFILFKQNGWSLYLGHDPRNEGILIESNY